MAVRRPKIWLDVCEVLLSTHHHTERDIEQAEQLSGFEDYFREVSARWGDLEAFAEISRKYELDMDFDSVPVLCERFGLTFPEL